MGNLEQLKEVFKYDAEVLNQLNIINPFEDNHLGRVTGKSTRLINKYVEYLYRNGKVTIFDDFAGECNFDINMLKKSSRNLYSRFIKRLSVENPRLLTNTTINNGFYTKTITTFKDPLITQERYKEICNQFGVPNISEELAKNIIKWLDNPDNFKKTSDLFGFIQKAYNKKDNEK